MTNYNRVHPFHSHSTSNLLDVRKLEPSRGISPKEKSICFDLQKDITEVIDMENKRVAKEVDLIFERDHSNSKPRKEVDTKKKFRDISIQIRHLNSELRRILKTETDQPTLIEPNV